MSDLTEKSKYILRLEKDLNNLGLRLKYNKQELQEKENELSKLDFKEKQTVLKLEQVMKDQEEIQIDYRRMVQINQEEKEKYKTKWE